MPRFVLPFSGPASNFMSSRRGNAFASSASTPSYTAPMPVLVNLWPSMTIVLPASISAGAAWPSISSAVTRQEPCSRSRSVVFLILDRAPRHAQRLSSFQHFFQDPVALTIVLPLVARVRLHLAIGAIAALG